MCVCAYIYIYIYISCTFKKCITFYTQAKEYFYLSHNKLTLLQYRGERPRISRSLEERVKNEISRVQSAHTHTRADLFSITHTLIPRGTDALRRACVRMCVQEYRDVIVFTPIFLLSSHNITDLKNISITSASIIEWKSV